MSVLGSGTLIREQLYGTGTSIVQSMNSQTYTTIPINGTNFTGDRHATNNNIIKFSKQSSNSYLMISITFPCYLATGGSGIGIRCAFSTDDTTYYNDALDNGPAHGWSMMGYGGGTGYICRMMWDSRQFDLQRSSGITAHTGDFWCYFQTKTWVSTDSLFMLGYSVTYPKYGSMSIREYLA